MRAGSPGKRFCAASSRSRASAYCRASKRGATPRISASFSCGIALEQLQVLIAGDGPRATQVQSRLQAQQGSRCIHGVHPLPLHHRHGTWPTLGQALHGQFIEAQAEPEPHG